VVPQGRTLLRLQNHLIIALYGSPQITQAAHSLISPREMHHATPNLPSFSLRRGGGRQCLFTGSCPKEKIHRLLRRCYCICVLYSNANPAHGSQLIQGDNVSLAFQYVSGGPPREIPALPRGAAG